MSRMRLRYFLFAGLVAPLFAAFPVEVKGQANPLHVEIANLRSDVDRLDQLLRSVRLEVEALRRETRQTRDWVEERLSGNRSDQVTRTELNAILSDFERRIQSANGVNRTTLVNEVSQEIEALAEQTQKAINALAKSIEGQPQLEQVIVFSDDYPRSGTSYTVKRGDSIGKIARQLGSKVDWIRNANRLSSDIIFPGQELFIPLED
jgi:LysM repeat protein